MGGGTSCFAQDGTPLEMVCPTHTGGTAGGEAHIGSREWNTETHSYVSIGLFNVFMTTTITSGGLLLGVFLGCLMTLGVWLAVYKRKQRLLKKAKAKQGMPLDMGRIMVPNTGTHSTTWPAMGGPMGQTTPPATAPTTTPPQPTQLVPLAWRTG